MQFNLNEMQVNDEATSVQERQLLAMRSFYSDEKSLLDQEIETLSLEDPLDVVLTSQEAAEVAPWLSRPEVWIAFRPSTFVDDDGRTILRLN